jgi:hypothetical protein
MLCKPHLLRYVSGQIKHLNRGSCSTGQYVQVIVYIFEIRLSRLLGLLSSKSSNAMGCRSSGLLKGTAE